MIPYLTVYAVLPSSLVFLLAYSYASQRFRRQVRTGSMWGRGPEEQEGEGEGEVKGEVEVEREQRRGGRLRVGAAWRFAAWGYGRQGAAEGSLGACRDDRGTGTAGRPSSPRTQPKYNLHRIQPNNTLHINISTSSTPQSYSQTLFNGIVAVFMTFFAGFALWLYPNHHLLHPTSWAEGAAASLPLGLDGVSEGEGEVAGAGSRGTPRGRNGSRECRRPVWEGLGLRGGRVRKVRGLSVRGVGVDGVVAKGY